MTASPDPVHELRAARPVAPDTLRLRVRELAARDEPRRSVSWLRAPSRRVALVALPAAASVAIASAGIVGLTRADAPGSTALRERAATDFPAAAESLQGSSAGKAGAGAAQDSGSAPGVLGAATPRAQRVTATLTLEVRDPNAVSKAAQSALDLTRSLGGYVVSSSVATGDEGSASLVVRVPVAKVQDAIVGFSGLGRIASQQVTTEDLQATLDELERREATVRSQVARLRARLATERLDPQTEAALRARLQTLRGELGELRTGIRATGAEARMATIQLAVVTPGVTGVAGSPSRIDRTIDGALEVLAWEGLVALGILMVLAPFALAAGVVWLARRSYRRREDERLLAA